jgi:hypothetical protein
MNATTLLALEFSVGEAGPSRFKLRQKHAIVLTLRAAGPFDGGNIS